MRHAGQQMQVWMRSALVARASVYDCAVKDSCSRLSQRLKKAGVSRCCLRLRWDLQSTHALHRLHQERHSRIMQVVGNNACERIRCAQLENSCNLLRCFKNLVQMGMNWRCVVVAGSGEGDDVGWWLPFLFVFDSL